ncbi:hypothetical protein EDM53_02865 [Rickettsiales endosymbiont of Peranema trichophorum]|uniref:hypothetical protein n=1 Tax=Rickettsiales endosymbiont of Peranema trichophorum TaxID=2486577 RepID=UPI0010239162|nr:hypothetical protein [Rickettsiales endosymbiont of Peranema trichophorum]RZI47291.1 hypothetical protein EDM53_02865 [Rickettsiales endosymbiont of Peranema trichophorum]
MTVVNKDTKIREILGRLKEQRIEFVDFRFTDTLGRCGTSSHSVSAIREHELLYGVSFKELSECSSGGRHLVLRPDLGSYWVDPVASRPTVCFMCDITDGASNVPSIIDARAVAYTLSKHLVSSEIPEAANFTPTIQFLIFDDRDWTNVFNGYAEQLFVGARAPHVVKDRNIEALHKHASHISLDHLKDIRMEIISVLENMGVRTRRHSGTDNRCEITLDTNNILSSCDDLQKAKYVIRNIVSSYGKSVTFMPQPFMSVTKSGMLIEHPIPQYKESTLGGDVVMNLKKHESFYIGGILKHINAICAFARPATNSYKGLQDDATRARMLIHQEANKLELAFVDSIANPYLTFAAIVMAGLDGIINKVEPTFQIDPTFENVCDGILEVQLELPTCFQGALDALKDDQEFLKRGNVFSSDMMETFIRLKELEIVAIQRVPHPEELRMYYNI